MRVRFKKVLVPVATVSVSCVVAVLVAEIALRLVGFEFVFFPTKVQFGWPDPVVLRAIYEVDKELLWVPTAYPEKVASWEGKRPALVFMGDSCTQFGRYDEFLEEIIKEHHPNGDFDFVNVGVGGWSSYQGLAQLKRDVLPMKPGVITIYYGWNDHWSSFGIEDKDIGRFNLKQPSFLVYFTRVRVVQLIHRAMFSLEHSEDEENIRKPERVSLSDFTTNLLQMVQIARAHEIVPVLLTAASSHRKGEEPAYLGHRWLNDPSELVPLHQSYIEAVRHIATQENVLLIDLAREFELFSPEERKLFFRQDGIHFTEAGDRKIAELMYDHFQRFALVDRLTSKQ